jgi:hypothetical protein
LHFMRFLRILFPALLLLAGCQKQDVRLKVLIGATVVEAPGAQPIPDAIIVIAGSRIRSVGIRKDIPVPQYSDRTDLAGEWIVPAEGSRIAIDEPANLLILKHAPMGATPGSDSDITARITAGEWETPSVKTGNTQTGSTGQSH